jgi:hypothetical protein
MLIICRELIKHHRANNHINGQMNWTDIFSKEEIQMPKILWKKCSVFLASREIQIKTALKFNLTPVRMAIIKNIKNKCWWVWGEKGNLIHYLWECKLVQLLWKSAWKFLKKLKREIVWSTIPGYIPERIKGSIK